MKLVKFDQDNPKHLKAFDYFANLAGHPEYLCNGVISDSDIGFREVLADKFNLDECFVEEPNGSNHELVSRTGNVAVFNAYYGTENDQNGYDEISFRFEGVLFYNETTEKVVMEPILHFIEMTSEVK